MAKTALLPPLVHCRRPAMATFFELWLAGDDEEHLSAVGEAALDEIVRVERLLSRFDATSEVARINRDAAREPVRVDFELLAILEDCLFWWERTDGAFDLCAHAAHLAGKEGLTFGEAVELDRQNRTVRFLAPQVALDFGGYGKGYALDRAGDVLSQFGVTSALLHGGTSSVLARGTHGGAPWRIAVRDPFAADAKAQLGQISLAGCGFSSSAVSGGQAVSDLLNPHDGRPLSAAVACSVLAPTAREAEALSTALLALGKQHMGRFAVPPIQVAWIEQHDGGAAVDCWPPSGSAFQLLKFHQL